MSLPSCSEAFGLPKPITVHDYMRTWLVDNLLWPQEADQIIAAYLNSPLGKEMASRTGEPADGYGPAWKMLFATICMGLRKVALEWLEANKPQHFAKPMFLPQNE